MGLDISAPMTITAPADSDGRGEIAVLNDSTSGNFVGYVFDSSGFDGPSVRTSMDDIPQGHGAVLGSFYHGARSFTLDVVLALAATSALSFARRDKLYRAFNAMAADGTIVYTETGGSARLLSFRREQPPRGPNADRHVLLSGISADPRIYKNTPTTGTSPQTNNGNAGSLPTFTFTPSGGTVVITNTTSGLGSPALSLAQGTGYLSTGSAVTVDFNAKTVVQGGVSKYASVIFPTSIWWEVVPGANTFTVSNASSVSISFRDASI